MGKLCFLDGKTIHVLNATLAVQGQLVAYTQHFHSTSNTHVNTIFTQHDGYDGHDGRGE